MAPELPPSIRIKGGMVTSHVPGNGLYFDHEDLAAMAAQVAGAPFVANHDRDISDRAGTLKTSSAERFEVEFDTYTITDAGKPPRKTGTKREKATLLRYEAELSDDFPSYGKVAQSILAIAKSGGIPNVSVAVAGEALLFDDETQRFIFKGPYRFLHLGHVDIGAFGPDVGVGVDDVQVVTEAQLTFAATEPNGAPTLIPCETRLYIANRDDLVLNFLEQHADHPRFAELQERLGKALGKDARRNQTVREMAVRIKLDIDGLDKLDAAEQKLDALSAKADATAADRARWIPATGATAGWSITTTDTCEAPGVSNSPPAEKIDPLSGTAPEPASDMEQVTMTPTPAKTEAPAPAPKADSKVEAAVAELQAKIKAMEEREAAANARAFSEKRDRLVSEYGLKAEDLASFQSIEQLDVVERALANARSNALPREQAPSATPAEEQAAQKAESDRQAWLREVAAVPARNLGRVA